MLVLLCLYSCQFKPAHAINEEYLFMSEEDCICIKVWLYSYLLKLVYVVNVVSLFMSVEAWARGYKTFFVLNSVEHEISNAHKYKNIKKFSFCQAQISGECYFSCS